MTVDEPQAVTVDEPKALTVDEPQAVTVDEWQALTVLKEIYRQLRKDTTQEAVTAKVSEELALYMLNNKRVRLSAMEEEFKKKITIHAL